MILLQNRGSDMTNALHDVANEAANASPPLAVVGLHFAGVTLNDVVLILTAVYTLVQIIILVRDRIVRPRREARDADPSESA
ncbi:holin [Ralstonia phage PQ43W]